MKEMLNRDFIENFIKYHKKTIIKAFAGLLFFAAAFFVFCIRENDNNVDSFQLTENVADANKVIESGNAGSSEESSSIDNKEEKSDKKEVSVIFVDVSGAVNKPNVYEMTSGSRVFEAIEKAGGLINEADTSTLNLAQVLSDQDKLTIPVKGQIKSSSTQPTIINRQSDMVTNPVENMVAVNASANSGLININTASSEQLQTITGIGPATAEKILLYRQEQGNFEKIEDIKKVSGIGEKTFEKFKTKIMV